MNVTIETSTLNNGFRIPFNQTHVSEILNDLGMWTHCMHYGQPSFWEYRLYFTLMN